MHTKEAAAAIETAVRLDVVAAWRGVTMLADAERAAPGLVEQGTRVADAPNHGASDRARAQARMHDDGDAS